MWNKCKSKHDRYYYPYGSRNFNTSLRSSNQSTTTFWTKQLCLMSLNKFPLSFVFCIRNSLLPNTNIAFVGYFWLSYGCEIQIPGLKFFLQNHLLHLNIVSFFWRFGVQGHQAITDLWFTQKGNSKIQEIEELP